MIMSWASCEWSENLLMRMNLCHVCCSTAQVLCSNMERPSAPIEERDSDPDDAPEQIAVGLRYEVSPQSSEFTLGKTLETSTTAPWPQVSIIWAHGNLHSSTKVSHEFAHAQDLFPDQPKPGGRDIMFVASSMQKTWDTLQIKSIISQEISISAQCLKVTGTIRTVSRVRQPATDAGGQSSDARPQFWH